MNKSVTKKRKKYTVLIADDEETIQLSMTAIHLVNNIAHQLRAYPKRSLAAVVKKARADVLRAYWFDIRIGVHCTVSLAPDCINIHLQINALNYRTTCFDFVLCPSALRSDRFYFKGCI